MGKQPIRRCWPLGRRAALALALCSLGCKRESATLPPEPSARPATTRGDLVVVERSAAVFVQTRVLEVAQDKLRVDFEDGGESTWVQSSDAYAIGRKVSLAAGALAICQHRSEWRPCKIEEVGTERLRARDARGKPFEVGPLQVIEPRPVTELNLKRHFERVAAREAFQAAYAKAGKPARPRGWLPGPRARVIAARGGEWYSAQIFEFDEKVPRVSFALDGRVTEIAVADLAPQPPHDLSGVRRGDFVLKRPPGPAEPWKPVEVRSVGDNELRVADASGELYTVPFRDVVPLSADR